MAVESVAWISEFKNTVSLPFLLLSCLAFVEYDARRRRGMLLLSVVLFLASLACKTSVVMFPFVLVLFSWWRRGRVAKRDIAVASPFFAASLVLGIATLVFQSHRAIGTGSAQEPLMARVAQAGWSLLSYIRQAIVPTGLAPIYEPVHAGILSVIPWVVLAIAFGIFWRRRTGWGRHAILGWGWFLINLVPVLGILPMAYMRIAPRADHFAYVSLVGLAGMAAACADWVCARLRARSGAAIAPRLCLGAVVAGLLAFLCLQSHAYSGVFHDEKALWTYAVAQSPDAWLARNNLGKALQAEGQSKEASAQFAEAVRLRPDSPEAYANWGNALDSLGLGDAARREFALAIRTDPGFAGGHYDLGLSLMRAGRLDEAAAEFTEALRLNPAYAVAHNNLGLALAHTGHLPEAMEHYRMAIRNDPALQEAHLNLGNALLRLGNLQEAVAEFREALKIDPAYSGAHNNLSIALRQLGRDSEADAESEAARRTANH
jgi:tetratricopeptide (TPR) repeat protein